MAVAAALACDKEEHVDRSGELLKLACTAGHPVADGVVGHEILGPVSLDIGGEATVFVAALGGLRVEPYGTGEVDGGEVVGAADYDGGAVGLPVEAHHLGMAGLAEDDYLCIGVLEIGFAYAFL